MTIAPQKKFEIEKPIQKKKTGKIHPTALIDPDVQLGDNVTVGAYTVIGAGVVIGDDTEVMNHVSLDGPTTIGVRNKFFPYSSVGLDPQDKKYAGEAESFLEIGDDNVFREFSTAHRGTPNGRVVTKIGNENLIMNYCHVAHDCWIGDNTIFANGAICGGHVTLQDNVYLGGITAIHQYCTVGTLAMTGAHTMIAQDVPPYVIATGNRVGLYGVNKIGMERSGISEEEIRAMTKAYKIFFRGKSVAKEALTRIEEELGDFETVRNFVKFVRNSERGICR